MGRRQPFKGLTVQNIAAAMLRTNLCDPTCSNFFKKLAAEVSRRPHQSQREFWNLVRCLKDFWKNNADEILSLHRQLISKSSISPVLPDGDVKPVVHEPAVDVAVSDTLADEPLVDVVECDNILTDELAVDVDAASISSSQYIAFGNSMSYSVGLDTLADENSLPVYQPLEATAWSTNAPSLKASFDVPADAWLSVTSSIVGRYAKCSDWTDLIRKGLNSSNPYCSFAFRRHSFNYGPSPRYFVCTGYCAFKSCNRRFIVEGYRDKPFVATFSGSICHEGIKTMRISGIQRSKFRDVMRNRKPRAVALDCLSKLPQDVYDSGNRDAAPSAAILKKGRQESIKIDVPNKSNQ